MTLAADKPESNQKGGLICWTSQNRSIPQRSPQRAAARPSAADNDVSTSASAKS